MWKTFFFFNFFRIRLYFSFVWELDFGRNSDVVAFDYWEVNGSWWQPLPTKNIWFWYNIKSYFVRRNPLYFFWTGNIKFCDAVCTYNRVAMNCGLNSGKSAIFESRKAEAATMFSSKAKINVFWNFFKRIGPKVRSAEWRRKTSKNLKSFFHITNTTIIRYFPVWRKKPEGLRKKNSKSRRYIL